MFWELGGKMTSNWTYKKLKKLAKVEISMEERKQNSSQGNSIFRATLQMLEEYNSLGS